LFRFSWRFRHFYCPVVHSSLENNLDKCLFPRPPADSACFPRLFLHNKVSFCVFQVQDTSEEVQENVTETEEASTEEEEEKPKITVEDVKTAPMDYRFPTTNQAKHCYTRYNEFHKCASEKGDDARECKKYAKYYRSLCPGDWVDKWNEERENGTFPGRY
jgi:cytochrome c oxidase subunit 6b